MASSVLLLVCVCGTTDWDVAELLRHVESGSREEQIAALDQLERAAIDGKLGEQRGEVIARCASLLTSEDGEIADTACDVLSWLDAEVLPAMTELLRSEDDHAQGFAARVLAAVASREREDPKKLDAAIPELEKLMRDGGKYARHNAFYAMSALGPKAIPLMAQNLDAEDYFFNVMMRGFLRHGELSIGPLAQALSSEDVVIRRNAACALFRIATHKPETLPRMKADALEPLTEAIGDEDSLVRAQANDALGRMGEHAAGSLNLIVAALEEDEPAYLAIAGAVAEIGARPKHLDALFQAVRHAGENPEIEHRQVVWKFGAAIGSVDESCVPRIVKMVDDPNSTVSETAMYALFSLGPKATVAIPTVVRKMNAGHALAPQILGAMGAKGEPAIPALIEKMQHDAWASPRGAFMIVHYSPCASALANIGATALPALLEGLGNEQPEVRAGCLVALETMNPDLMVPQAPLLRMLRDEHPIVRGLAIRAMVKHGDPTTIKEAVAPLQNDDHRGVARSAQRAIEDLEAKEPD